MSWARFDDAFWSHPKVVRAGNEATGAFVRLVCYCAQYLTDGAVSAGAAREIARPKVLARLVEVGLLEVAEGGYSIHGYLEKNPSRAQVERERAAKTSRQNRWRETRGLEAKSSQSAAKVPLVDASTDASRDASKDDAPSRPVPSRPESTACSPRASTSAHAPASEARPTTGAGWWLDPWEVANRLRERSGGRISLTLNGHEREFARTLATISAQRPRLAQELDHWAALAARGDTSWWRGAWSIGALLGRADESGRRAADGLLRCLDEAASRLPSPRPPTRPARPEPEGELLSPEQAEAMVAAARERRAAAAREEAARG